MLLKKEWKQDRGDFLSDFVIWMLYNKVNDNEKDIAVIKAQHASSSLHHDREMKEMRDTIKAIFNKLDNIEQSLRNR